MQRLEAEVAKAREHSSQLQADMEAQRKVAEEELDTEKARSTDLDSDLVKARDKLSELQLDLEKLQAA